MRCSQHDNSAYPELKTRTVCRKGPPPRSLVTNVQMSLTFAALLTVARGRDEVPGATSGASIALRTVIDLRATFARRRPVRPRHKAPPWLRSVVTALHCVARSRLSRASYRIGAAAAAGALTAAALAVLVTMTFEKGAGHDPALPRAAPTTHAPAFTLPLIVPHPAHHSVSTSRPRSSRAEVGGNIQAGSTPPPGTRPTPTSGTHSRIVSSWKKLARDYGAPGWALKLVAP
jgi:hypothetical protein